ncbi:MAG TPA: hypothetical protein QGF08_06055 [Candidatus Marinimicrobia bacterium]|nr:hypothetical protein [Candidatus Neomarinimicrobiota bacterium]
MFSFCSDTSLFQQRYKTRVVLTSQIGRPLITRTYDLAVNELKKEEHFYSNGIKKHECLYANHTLQTGSPVLWWYNNGQIQSRTIFSENDQIVSIDIWYNNGVKQFSFYGNVFTWWNEKGHKETVGTLDDFTCKLPIITTRGRIAGQRIATGLENRTWQEEWVLFDGNNHREFSGLVQCTLTSRQNVHREAIPGWINEKTGKRYKIENQLQDILNNHTRGFYFVIIDKMGKNNIPEEDNNSEKVSELLRGKEKTTFKARQYQRMYELILNADGTFIHSWDKGRLDKSDLESGYATGHFAVNSMGTKAKLYYKQGLHSGEAHELEIVSHREIKYSFRGTSYFLR